MVGKEEQFFRSTVDSLTLKANAALKENDPAALKQIYTAQIEPLGKIAQKRAHDYDFAQAEMVLERLREVQAALQPMVSDKEKTGIEARILYSEAIVCDVRGTFDLFDKLEFVSAPVELEKAAVRYERAAELSEKLGVDSSVTTSVRGMALRVRGIRSFGLGRFNIEAADLPRARRQLDESKTALESAARALQPSADAGTVDAESAMYPGYCLSLAASADAFKYRCQADEEAFSGKYDRAAKLLAQQLAQMEQSKSCLLNVISKVGDSLAHRTAQEMELCDKRQKFFARLPSGSSVTRATLSFVALTLFTFACQVVALKFIGAEMDHDYYLVMFAASLVVGGIGAGLTSWTNGTDWFKKAISLTGEKSAPDEKASEK